MGQGFSLTTLSAGSAGIDVPELSDLSYEKSLGTARFMKSIRARHQHGLVVIKVAVKPFQAFELGKYVKAIRHERDALADVPNALGYQRVLETSTSGYLVRQYLYSSLYDRMSTRPFLEDVEKKWLAFQLLCALRDCHARNIFHGDIKTENILVTSWNWLYLTDFSSAFKKTYLPEDNPADFSYFFDTSGRRTCYLAPERFLGAGEAEKTKGVTWAMDIFSVGCVIAELFLEAPIFSLSQLFKYRKGEYDPQFSQCDKIEDKEVREMVMHMIQVDPESRYSADEYLYFWRRKAFPEYFYSFLHQYMGLITDPSSGRAPVMPETTNFGEADDRIDRIYYDFDKISYFLGYENLQAAKTSNVLGAFVDNVLPVLIDIPSNRHLAKSLGRRSVDDGTLIFLTLVVSSLRNTARATARLRACDLMLAFGEKITDEAKLDRVLPYLVVLLNDRADIVKVTALRTITQLLSLVSVVSPVNAYVFTEYVRPRLQHMIQGPGPNAKPAVRATYASCLAPLAHTSSRILDMVQALRADGSIPTIDPEAEDGIAPSSAYQNLFDVARIDLVEHFESHTKALLTDNAPSVRRAFLGSVSSLCVFFGSAKANDVILSHLNTYLNDKDWMLKCAFFQTIVGVATFVGGSSLEDFILPLMVQALTDPEEFVVEKVLSSFSSMAELGLFQRSKTWEMVDVVARFMMHPNIWIREAAVHYVSSATKFLTPADTRCVVLPLIQPYLKNPIVEFSVTKILDALKKPLPRAVLEMAASWAIKVERGLFWKTVKEQRTFSFAGPDQSIPTISSKTLSPNSLRKITRNDEDEQWLTRLRNLGMGLDDEFKLLALRDYIGRMAQKRATDATGDTSSRLNSIISLKEVDVTPQTIFFENHKKQGRTPLRYSRSELKFNEARKTPHTIADALLDASTTIDESLAYRKKSYANNRKDRMNGDSPLLPVPIDLPLSRRGSSNVPSPLSSSPGARYASLNSATPKENPFLCSYEDCERSVLGNGFQRRWNLQDHMKRVHDYIGPPDPKSHFQIPSRGGTNDAKSDGTLTPTGSLRTGDGIDRTYALRHKSSAITLLNRRDTPKTVAETSTTSTNAVGTVDGPFSRDTSDVLPSSTIEKVEEKKSPLDKIQAGHTYDGNDPNVIRLLDSLASENYPIDLVDFGPMVTSVTNRHLPKKTDSQDVEMPWRPQGILVATFGEHSGSINRVIPSPDHRFFITASDDGTVKVWDTLKLEKNLAHRSRQTYKHREGSKVTCIAFVEKTHTFISGASDGSVHVVKVDCVQVGDTSKYGKLRRVREYQLPDGEHAVWTEHFKSDATSICLLATTLSRVVALDLRTMNVLYTFENPTHHGTLTCFCVDKKHNWLCLGTSHGILDIWDLRFKLRLKAFGLSGGTPIHRLRIYPFHGRGRWVCVAGGTAQNEITVWDLEKSQCRAVYRAGSNSGISKENLKIYDPWKLDEEKPEGMLDRFATSLESTANGGLDRGIRALEIGQDAPEDGRDAKYGFFLTGSCDRKVRFWDIFRAEASAVVSGLELDESQPKYLTTHPTTMLTINIERSTQSGPSAPNAAPGIVKTQSNTTAKRAASRPSRSTVISQQQQHLLRTHLDTITDVALLESPVGMTVSVDRSGVIYVFQ